MSRSTAGALAFSALALGMVACQTQTGPTFTEIDRAAIEHTVQEALALANTEEDYTAYVETYYAPDAVVMPPNQPAVQGRAAIAEMLGSLPPLQDVQYDVQLIEGSGDIAYVKGAYSFLMVMADMEEPVPDRGKYIEVWRRQPDGGWKVAFDIFNSDLPLPAPQ